MPKQVNYKTMGDTSQAFELIFRGSLDNRVLVFHGFRRAAGIAERFPHR
jgi:hypothetical protein